MKQSQISSETSEVTCEWQSDADPWSYKQPQWMPYTPHENDLIEKAYQNDQEIVDLIDYTVLIKNELMFQRSKKDSSKQRPVRRRNEELRMTEEEDLRKERFFGAETPKTYNKTFGSLQDLLLHFERRGPEIKRFANTIREVEVSQDFNKLNQHILPVLINSIKKESAKTLEKKGKQEIIELFEGELTSFHQF